MKKDEVWDVKCACGCGGDVPRQKRRNRGRHPKFINNHWWNLPSYKLIIKERNKKRTKEVPDIAPCTGRRLRNGKYYSRSLMEEKLGRKLLPHECVHHINGDKTDDRIENLTVLTKSQHSKLHNENKRVECRCKFCGKTLQLPICRYKRSKRHYCDRKCFSADSLRTRLSTYEYNRYFYKKARQRKSPNGEVLECKT